MLQAGESIRLSTGGDVKFAKPEAVADAVASAPAVGTALKRLIEADVCFMNCEMPLTDGGNRVEKTINLRSDPGVANTLAEMKIDVVTVANNHMLDWGHTGLANTLNALDASGVARVGAGATLDEALVPHFQGVGSVKLAFIGVAATLPPGFAAGPDRPGIAPIRVDFSFEIDANLMSEQPGTAPFVHTRAVDADVELVSRVIAEAREKADYVIVAMHWGLTRRRVTPYQGMIAEYQPILGRALIDAGADAIIGNHSHNLHPIEVYRGRPIFYSLGNFIFENPHDYMEPESFIVYIDLSSEGLAVNLLPIIVNEAGFPVISEGEERDHIIRLVTELSEPSGTEFIDHGDLIEVVLNS